MEEQVLHWITQYGYIAIYLCLVFGIVGLPIPDETMMTFSGYLVYTGTLSLPLTLMTALAGSISGITISYALGRFLGMTVVHKYGKYFRLDEAHIAKAHAWFDRIGHWALTVGYFIPGVRHFTAYAAGISELSPRTFAIYAYMGSLLWVSTFISLGYFLGERWKAVEANIHVYLLWGGIAIGVLLIAYFVWWKWIRKKPQ
jgi:membrane protein DedA with SNARE-associated domain